MPDETVSLAPFGARELIPTKVYDGYQRKRVHVESHGTGDPVLRSQFGLLIEMLDQGVPDDFGDFVVVGSGESEGDESVIPQMCSEVRKVTWVPNDKGSTKDDGDDVPKCNMDVVAGGNS